jgi:1,5-anhydro-D-fructose reductase (1,5-anhydro-D-mannitol-forming)
MPSKPPYAGRRRAESANWEGPAVRDGERAAEVGWGIIGASAIARTYMVDAIRSAPDARLLAVASRSLERAERFARECSVPRAYGSVAELLADPEIDAVYVSSLNSLHAPQTIAAAKAGKHVLCEKPLAVRVADALEMRDACRAAGVVLAVNHHLRNAPIHLAVRAAIADGAIGTPLSGRVWHTLELLPELRTWRLTDPDAGAGALLDLTVHSADLLRFLLGDDVVEVVALAATQTMASEPIEDVAAGALRLRSGALFAFHDAFNLPEADTGLEIHGSGGSIVVNDALADDPVATAELFRDGSRTPLPPAGRHGLYERQVRCFHDAIRGAGAPAATAEDGIRSTAVALACAESARTGRAVAPEALPASA